MLPELRDKVKKLLHEKTVDLVIGWQKGSLPMSSTPLFMKTEESDSLGIRMPSISFSFVTIFILSPGTAIMSAIVRIYKNVLKSGFLIRFQK